MRALSLFSGIGGLDLAAEAAGIEVIAQCEIEPFCQTILKLRWPNAELWSDVRSVAWGQYRRANAVQLIFGGSPCQDLSVAGRQAGLEGERSGLWYELLRAVEAIRPRYVLNENVRGAVDLAFDTMRNGLEAACYEVRGILLAAASFGAPHRRERMFVLSVRNDVADACRKRVEGRSKRGEIRGLREESSDGEAGCGSSVMENAGSILLPRRFERRDIQATRGTGLAVDAEFPSRASKLWPTPRAAKVTSENLETWERRREQGDVATPPLGLAVKMSLYAQASHRENVTGGQLNPDWVEQLMNFPEGWTNPECKEPQPWQGWPAPLGARLWMTPTAGAKGMTSTNSDRPPEKSTALTMQTHLAEQRFTDQYAFEFPRTVTGQKYRANRLKALGNAVVPAQAASLFKAIAEIERMVTD